MGVFCSVGYKCYLQFGFIDFFRKNPIVSLIVAVIEIVSCIILSFLSDKATIEDSEQLLNDIDNRNEEIYKWLRTIQIYKKNQIKQLRNELKILVHNNKSTHLRRKKEIEKWFQILLIPIILSVSTYIFQLQGTLDEKIQFIFLLALLLIALYIGIIGFLNFINLILNMQSDQITTFINSLQGILDRKFDIEDDDIIELKLD